MNVDLPSEVVRQVLASGRFNTPETLLPHLEELSKMRQRVLNRNSRITQVRKESAEKIKQLEAESLCTHEVTKTHGDPSGGSDSEVECLICGEWIGRG